MTMLRRTSTIEQHIGDHATGVRMMRLHEVVTVVDGATERDADVVDDLHDAEVELASMDAGPRKAAMAWLDEHADEIVGSDEAVWIRLAIAHVKAA